MPDLVVDYAMLTQVENTLKGLAQEFQNIQAQEQGYTGAYGSGDIAGAMNDFADNWSYHRGNILKSMDSLAGSDPVPGDPQRIGEEAAHLASVAQEIQGQVARLRAIATGHTVEKGLHVDKLKSASADVADSLDKVVGRYQKTSAALSGWVPELEYAQGQSLKALAQAQDAAGRQRANQPPTYPSVYKETPQDKQNDQSRANALNQANADLAAARQMLDNATSYRDQKGSDTRNKIENAINDGVADQWYDCFASAWDSFSNWVTQHADLIKKIADIAGLIASICGILSLLLGWIPIVGQALAVVLDTVATIATLVRSSGRRSQWSWTRSPPSPPWSAWSVTSCWRSPACPGRRPRGSSPRPRTV